MLYLGIHSLYHYRIIKKENKIDSSNVQIICPECGKATRIAHKTVDGKSVRVCKNSGCDAVIDKVASPKKASKKTADKTSKAN